MAPKALNQKKVEDYLQDYPEWQLDPSGKKLITAIEFENFAQAISFINSIGEIAEELDHHPDIYLYNYKYVQILTYTHSVGGFTEKDFDLMEDIDELLNSKGK
jgi:4a-hydroxytetrahydrobiopterin dehydratase